MSSNGSTIGSTARPSQRSSSTTRSSRRATLSIGPGSGLLNGSLSPQRVLRTKALRERGNDRDGHTSSDASAIGKTKAGPKTVPKGVTKAQQMQFAFGSKVMKPSSTKSGMSGTAGEARGKAHGGAVADGANALARPRRERAARGEAHEQHHASSRGRGATHMNHQSSPAGSTREERDAATLKAQLEERDMTIADLRRRLEKDSARGEDVSGRKDAETTRSTVEQLEAATGGTRAPLHEQQQQKRHLSELDEGAQAALRAVEEEARADAEDALLKVETVAAASLSQTEEMQARVDEMIRLLKTRRQ